MKDKFLAYYWPWFKIFGLIFLFAIVVNFIDERDMEFDIQKIFRLLFIPLFMSLFMGGIFHSFYELYKPWRKKRIFHNSLIRKVEIDGFKQDIENNCLEGNFNGYYVTLDPNSELEKGDSISINVFVDIRKSEINFVLDKIQEYELLQSSGYYWITVSEPVSTTGKVANDKILEKITDITLKLQQHSITPFLVQD